MQDHKTSTSLRIGISVAMIIMMLGLALALNAFTTYAITNQMKVLSDLNIPVSQEITRMYAIQQMQQHSISDMVTYQKMSSNTNYEISKSQFESYNQEWDYEIKKIKDLIDTFLNYGLDSGTARNLSILSTNLNEIESAHLQYVQRADQIFETYYGNTNNLNSVVTGLEAQQNQIILKTILLNDEAQKLTDSLNAGVDESKQKAFTWQLIIITSAGIMSLALGYFLNLINKDLVREVIRKTRSLQKANKKLEKMNILKDDFINIASHELKSPLHPIYGFVELAQNGDIGADEALAGISKQARQLEEIANRILDISRIDNGSLYLSYEKFDLSNMLLEITSSQGLNLDGKIKIETSLEKGISIEADRVRIGQVVRNLLNNALKFTEEGTIRVIVRYNLQKNLVEVTIRDCGPGIHPEILPKLFNKFITKGPKTESWKGNGLGLYLSREIINAHGGHIFAHNNKEAGATFKFTIPIMRHLNAIELHEKIMN
ncbi:MAG: HAMP domain-containing histidine kinase [Thaumarchaeota archaeon]|nr:HAMP domain-containing histidine kinase [Nitrososphaerota archaeon]MDE1838532.1 HAMP domain-containing histidine kinase [Nitrososphaerota archaeon]